MDIVYASNDFYARHLADSMISLFDRNQQAEEITVYVLSVGITEESRQKLQKIADQYHRNLELLDLTDDRAKGLIGKWTDNSGNEYKLKKDGKLVIKSSSGETKGTYCVAENADGTLRLNLVISGGTLEYVYTLSDDGSTVELCSPGTDTVHKWTKA